MSTRRISRRAFNTAALCTAAAVASPLVWPQIFRGDKRHLAVVLESRSAFSALPLTIADQLGYFRAEGLDVEFVEAVSGGRQLQDGVSGPADVVSGPFEQVIQLQGRGQFFQAFALQARAPQVALGISTRALPAYRSLADLRGCRIAIASPDSSASLVARLVLARGGLTPGQVSFVGLPALAEAVQSFRLGQFEAICHIDPVITQLEQRGELRIVGETRTLKGTQEIFGGPMPAHCLYAPHEFVQKNAAACQALANGLVHALKWLQTAGPSDIVRTVPEAYLLGDRAMYLAAFSKVRETISPDGAIAEEAVRTAIRTLASFDAAVRPERIDPAQCFTNAFTRRAKEKYRA